MSKRQGPTAAVSPVLRVIIADDAEETRQSVQKMMSLVPNSEVVAVGCDGREAIDLARQHHPDIALVDINMPEVDGLTAIETMRREQPNLICIVISAEKDPPTLERAIKVGVHGYLIKPITAEQLLSVMERASKMAYGHRAEAQKREKERLAYLEQLAEAHARSHRTDDEALKVFEQLAGQPDCNPRWLMTLAMMYVIRQKWAELQALAARIAKDQG